MIAIKVIFSIEKVTCELQPPARLVLPLSCPRVLKVLTSEWAL